MNETRLREKSCKRRKNTLQRLFKIAAIALILFSCSRSIAQVTKRVYLIGNSVTDGIIYDGLKSIAESRGNTHIWGRHMIPGSPLSWIWEHPADGLSEAPFGFYPNALPNYPWDAVSLQPFDRPIEGAGNDLEMIGNYLNLTKGGSPNVQIYIYSRYPRTPNDVAPTDASLTADSWNSLWNRTFTGGWDLSNESKDYFQQLLLRVRSTYTINKPVLLVPVGDVMKAVNDKIKAGQVAGYSKIWQLYSDGIHMNNVGSYLIACTFYATMYKDSPVGMAVPTQYGSINSSLATLIQQTVWEVVSTHPYAGIAGSSSIAVTGVSVSPTSTSVAINQMLQLNATVSPSNATNQAVTWTSSNTSVATVSSNGVVTGVSAGTANITVTTVDGNKTAVCALTVTAGSIAVSSVSVAPTSLSIKVGNSSTISATVLPSNATNKSVTWTSGNTSVATVNSSGSVTALAVGSTTVTATTADGNKTASCAVTVLANSPPVAVISATPTSGNAPLNVAFNSSSSSDPDAGDFILGFEWDFGDGSGIDHSTAPTHTFTNPGSYTVKLRVMDNNNLYSSQVSSVITVNGNSSSNTTINFESLSSGNLTSPYSDISGYRFSGQTSGGANEALVVESVHSTKSIRNSNFTSKVILERTDGAAFNLASFDYHGDPWDGSADATITGTLSAGGTLTSSMTGGASFATLTLNWTGLTKVVIDFNGGTNNSYGLLDNFVVSSGSGGTTSYTLNVSATNGTVSKSPNQATYTSGSNVSLTATANSGYSFAGWSGDASGTTNPLSVTMNGNKNITATFNSTGGGILTKYEAESATYSGGGIATDHTGYSGTGFWAWVSAQGNYVQFTVNASSAGATDITCRYANGQGTARTMSLYVNGTKIRQVSFPATASWDTWGDKVDNVTLVSGSNTIRYQYDSGDNGGFNIDYLSIGTVTAPTSYTLNVSATNGTVSKSPNQATYTSGSNVSLTATANSGYSFAGWSGDASGTTNPLSVTMNGNKNITATFNSTGGGILTKYEAESATYSGGGIATDHTGYSGTGFWAWVSAQGNYVQFTVNASSAGATDITCRYANGQGTARTMSLYVNGTKIRQVSFPATASWDTWGDKVDNVTLVSGSNTIRYQYDSGDNGGFNIDYLSIGTVTAPTSYTLNVSATNGTVSKSPNQATYISGSNVSLTATANSGYSFAGWSGDASGTTNPLSVTMNGNKNITATFNSTGGTTVSVTSVSLTPVTASVNIGSTVQLMATVSPSNATNKAVSYSTSNPSVATVGSSGIVTGINVGTAIITVTTQDGAKTATSTITVNTTTPPPASDLLDKNATASTVNLWNFLKSNYGSKMLTGCWTESQYGGNAKVVSCTGQYPAIWAQDMNSWYPNRTDALWIQTWNENIQGFKNAYARGQIIQVNWHWQAVFTKTSSTGSYTDDAWSSMTDQQWNDIVTPGTNLYNLMIEDLDYHVVNYLKKIVDVNGNPIPMIFRPLHEIDGGWFWWTCQSDPAKTAQLFKIIQDRIINYHGCHNLIWVYNPGVSVNGGSWPPYQPSEYARRRAFYPGDVYCDFMGIDLYDFDPIVRGTYFNTGKTYRDVWNEMKAITSTKMIALCESEGLPDAAKCFNDPNYAPWLYCLPWYSDSYHDGASNVTRDLCSWNNTQFNSPYVINAGVYQSSNVLAKVGTLGTVVTEVDDIERNTEVSVYPNPASEHLNVEINSLNDKGIATVVIIDNLGRVVYKNRSIASNKLMVDVSDYAKGVYILKAVVDSVIYTEKIIVR